MRKIIITYLTLLICTVFSSCEKDGNINKDFGQYSVAVNYIGSADLTLEFFMNGRQCGALLPMPNVNPTYVEDCETLNHPENLTNIFVVKEIPIGRHQIEVRTANGDLVKVLTFEMQNKECVFQELAIVIN